MTAYIPVRETDKTEIRSLMHSGNSRAISVSTEKLMKSGRDMVERLKKLDCCGI
jgi:hypothetical protein